MMRARDVMTAPVVTVGPDTPFKDVVSMLMDEDVSGLPVVDGSGAVVGVVTESDLVSKEGYPGPRPRILTALLDLLSDDHRWRRKAEGLTAGDVMTADPIVANPDESVPRIARWMVTHGINQVPVVSGGRLVGIVTRRDIVALFDRPDEAIAADIRARLASPDHTPVDQPVTFGVLDGVVTLEGCVRRPSQRAAVEATVRDVPGVVAVESSLTYLEPDPSVWPRP